MATLKELMGDLTRGDGRIVYSDDHGTKFEPIFLDSYGVWHGICDDFLVEAFDQFQEWDWEPYTEPKPKKKVKLYRYILKNTHTNLYAVNHWQSERPGNYHYDYKVVGTEEMEIEVDE